MNAAPLCAAVFFLSFAGAVELLAQDASAEALIDRARQARGSEADGLSAYEATIRERLYVGLAVSGFRRERGLYRSERVARVRWQSSGPETVEWMGIRERVPLAGVATEDEAGDKKLESYPLDPTGDRLQFGAEDFLHPLSDSTSGRYAYELGDTTSISIPAVNREIVMVEVKFQPKETAFELLAGSMWFDLESAALIRGVFRPSRPFNLELDDPDDAEELPGILKPLVVEFNAIVVEYGLEEIQWWIARRVRLEGVARVGRLLEAPVTLETIASDLVMNAGDLDPFREPPDGWTRTTVNHKRVVYSPPDSVLVNSPLLSNERFGNESDAFTDDELKHFRTALADISWDRASTVHSGIQLGHWRYNRVEALSASVRSAIPVGSVWELTGELRIGLGDRVPNAQLRVVRPVEGGRFSAAAYVALRSASDWGNPFSVQSSASTFLLGYDDGQYYRAAGGEIRFEADAGSPHIDGRLFAERHLAVSKHTDLSIPELLGSSGFPSNIESDEVDLVGFGGGLRLQAGSDPTDWVLLFGVRGEAATGSQEYVRASAAVGASRPIVGRLAAALELSGGATWGDVPAQKLWLLGGAASLRGFPGGSVGGAAFGLARFELAYGLPVVRLAAFTDMGWAGDRTTFLNGPPVISAGLGVSALDGIVRLDLAQVIQGRSPGRLRVLLYFDGLL